MCSAGLYFLSSISFVWPARQPQWLSWQTSMPACTAGCVVAKPKPSPLLSPNWTALLKAYTQSSTPKAQPANPAPSTCQLGVAYVTPQHGAVAGHVCRCSLVCGVCAASEAGVPCRYCHSGSKPGDAPHPPTCHGATAIRPPACCKCGRHSEQQAREGRKLHAPHMGP